ncbi:ubiquitin carboxyl-terminal hydrolase MINDY-2 [Paramormyrops kingsleyae]|uniref:Ubiquitin carboxyl-terminal hydrolase n=1 Tax=Paramormyrops kingsleyae TaxID=1676925 RepID=A0A3B3QKN6_9TELE|nr:ubiquitin carboxyl-terminal hydrolase MINDY-2 [Paramormyrops kingsleyae]
MEKSANLHRDLGGGTPCLTIAGETSDIKAPEVVKATVDSCKNSEPSVLSTLVASSGASSLSADTASALAGVQKSDVRMEIYDSPPAQNRNTQSTSLSEKQSEPGDYQSNGMECSLASVPKEMDGTTSKLVNKSDSDSPEIHAPTPGITHVQTGDLNCEPAEQTKMLPPTHLCPGETSLVTSKSEDIISSDHAGFEGPASGSEQSPAADSRSFDSLESFSNLNSCPSSDLNSEGIEDKVLAIALQNDEFGPDGPKVPCTKDRGAGQSIYHIKWIKWKEENTPIITQNENGPCPLLAIMNVLLLARKVKMPPMIEIITAEQLMEYLGDYILDAKPKEISEVQRLNYEQNMSDAMAVLHKLQTGLDVNVKFTGVRVFEYTPECIVFDLLDIPLYHGWLVDPQMDDIVKAVANCSYNQLVEKIISCKQSENSELAGEGFVAEQFLNSTATQLTYHGLCELTSSVQESELCVFFRNNHFSTMTKFKGQLYLLVTDQGFLTEEKVVWESLHNVDGDGNFCDSEFRLRPPSDPNTVYHGQQDQIDQDYLMALSLQQEQQSQDLTWEQIPEGISDLELAKKLQEEEDRRASQFYQEQEQAAQAQAHRLPAGGEAASVAGAGTGEATGGSTAGTAPSPGKQPSTGERKHKKEAKDKDKCVLL